MQPNVVALSDERVVILVRKCWCANQPQNITEMVFAFYQWSQNEVGCASMEIVLMNAENKNDDDRYSYRYNGYWFYDYSQTKTNRNLWIISPEDPECIQNLGYPYSID